MLALCLNDERKTSKREIRTVGCNYILEIVTFLITITLKRRLCFLYKLNAIVATYAIMNGRIVFEILT